MKQCYVDLSEHLKSFEDVQAIVFRDIFLNGYRIRVMGIHYMDFGLDWSIKRHSHSFFEFHYVTENDVYTTINGTEMLINAREFYLMPPGTYHSHRQDAGTGHVGFAVRWEADPIQISKITDPTVAPEFHRMMGQLTEARSRVVEDHQGNVLKSFLVLLDLTKQERFTITELQLVFLRFIIKVAGFYTRDSERFVQGINQTFLENRAVETAIRFIEENYQEEIDVNDISHSIHLSYSHLSRIFKKQTGETITGYLNDFRLKKAQHLLLGTDKSIGCIAVEVGFNSEHYFCSLFRKYFGITPGAFRKSKQRLSE